MATRVITVNEILDGHVGLDLECCDRIHLNGWVQNLQVPGQVVSFLTRHLGFPIPSPAVLERIGLGFCKAVAEFAAEHNVPVVRFAKGERKREVMRPYLERLERQGRTGVAAIGWRRSSSGCSPGPPTTRMRVGVAFRALATPRTLFKTPM